MARLDGLLEAQTEEVEDYNEFEGKPFIEYLEHQAQTQYLGQHVSKFDLYIEERVALGTCKVIPGVAGGGLASISRLRVNRIIIRNRTQSTTIQCKSCNAPGT